MSGRSLHPRASMAAVTLVALAGLNLFLFLTHQQHQAENNDVRSATGFLESSIPQLMSYRPDTVDGYRKTSLGLTAGPFRKKLTGVLDDAFAKDIATRQAGLRTTVQSVGVASSSGGEVIMLVYVNQWRTSAASKAPTVDNSRLKVTVKRVDGRWRVTDLAGV